MKIKFKKTEIEIIRETTSKIISLTELKEDSENNLLFKLLEECVKSEELTFELSGDASPYISRLYEILSEEFEMDDYDDL